MQQQQTMVKIVKPSKRTEKKNEDSPEKDSKVQRLIASFANKTMAEQLAGHGFYYRNYYWPGGRQAFPQTKNLHHVDKFFPFADGGPLYVDEQTGTDARVFTEKKEIMKKLGHRYVVLNMNMTMLEAYEALA